MISNGSTGVESSISIEPFSHSRATVRAVRKIDRIAMMTTVSPGSTNQRLLSSGLNRIAGAQLIGRVEVGAGDALGGQRLDRRDILDHGPDRGVVGSVDQHLRLGAAAGQRSFSNLGGITRAALARSSVTSWTAAAGETTGRGGNSRELAKVSMQPPGGLGLVAVADRELDILDVEIDRHAVDHDHDKGQNQGQRQREGIAPDVEPFLARHAAADRLQTKVHRRCLHDADEDVLQRRAESDGYETSFPAPDAHRAQASGARRGRMEARPVGLKNEKASWCS